MPTYEELSNISNCSEVIGSCPAWLTNGDNENISEIYGYWTFSTRKNHNAAVYALYYTGNIKNNISSSNSSVVGIRPVISVSTTDLSK